MPVKPLCPTLAIQVAILHGLLEMPQLLDFLFANHFLPKSIFCTPGCFLPLGLYLTFWK